MSKSRQLAISESPLVETIAAVIIVSLHFTLRRYFDPWSAIDDNTAQVIYQTGAGVVAVVAALAAVGLATGGAGDRGRQMRILYGEELRRNWRSLLYTSAAAPLLAITAQIAAANDQIWAPYVFEFALIWTGLRLVRLAWLVDALLNQEISEDRKPRPLTTGGLTQDFKNRPKAS